MAEKEHPSKHVGKYEANAIQWLRVLASASKAPHGHYAQTMLALVNKLLSEEAEIAEDRPPEDIAHKDIDSLGALLQDTAKSCLKRQAESEYEAESPTHHNDSEATCIKDGLLGLADAITQGIVILSATIAGKKTE